MKENRTQKNEMTNKNFKIIKISSLLASLAFGSQLFASQARLAPPIEGMQRTAIVVTPDLNGYPALKSEIGRVQAGLINFAQLTFREVLQGVLVSGGTQELTSKLATAASENLSPILKDINPKLPSDAVYMTGYIGQFQVQSGSQVFELPGLEKIQILEKDMSLLNNKEQFELMRSISRAMYDVAPVQNERYQFNAAAISLKLERNYVAIRVQILGELKPGQNDFTKENNQVKLNRVEILSGSSIYDRPMVLATVTQRIPLGDQTLIKRDEVNTYIPDIRVEFGKFGGLAGKDYGVFHGQLQLFEDRYDTSENCELNFQSVPSLVGVLADEPTGILAVDKLIGGSAVRFRIKSINFEIDKTSGALKVSDMKVPMTLMEDKQMIGGMLKCLDLQSVNQQFGDEAQAAIDEMIKRVITQDNATPELMNAIYE